MKIDNIYIAIIEGKFFEKIYQKVKLFVRNMLNGKYRMKVFKVVDVSLANRARKKMMQKIEVQNNKILFVTTRGSYNCNPKGIVDEILAQNLPWELVWVARKENLRELEQYPEKLKIVLRDSYDFFREAAQAKIWVDNSVNLSYMGTWKKSNQVLMETWHGSLGIKRFETNNDKKWIRKATECGHRTDFCISNSDFEDELFRNSFWGESEILKYGHARNDILFNENKKDEIKEKICERFGIETTCKIALYAPTFRDNKDLKPYNIDYQLLKEALEERFGGEWVVFTRLHFTVRKLAKKMNVTYPEFVFDLTDYNDIQDLLLIADVGITDYSSWICDYLLTRKPGFIFAVDLQDYYTERGFYYPLETAPFPLSTSNWGLREKILNFDEEKYNRDVELFLQKKGCIDDGLASKRVVEKMKEIINVK